MVPAVEGDPAVSCIRPQGERERRGTLECLGSLGHRYVKAIAFTWIFVSHCERLFHLFHQKFSHSDRGPGGGTPRNEPGLRHAAGLLRADTLSLGARLQRDPRVRRNNRPGMMWVLRSHMEHLDHMFRLRLNIGLHRGNQGASREPILSRLHFQRWRPDRPGRLPCSDQRDPPRSEWR